MPATHRFERPQFSTRKISLASIIIIIVIVLVPLSLRLFESVDPGHVKVATLFGKIQPKTYEAGLHFPVNPFYTFYEYDGRQKTHKEQAGVPSQDQLTTLVDVSVQYRLNADMAPKILSETGSAEAAISVHLVPKVRSVLREQGKTIKRAEDFFLEETQRELQLSLREGLQESLGEKGLIIEEVLIRDIQLPPRLISQIEQKKEAEQQAERQKAELARFTTETEQRVVEQEAERRAAEETAKMKRILAEAQAFEIEQINQAIAQNPAYIQLRAIEALMEISKDPATKLYFMDGNSPMPLPLMHMGDALIPK